MKKSRDFKNINLNLTKNNGSPDAVQKSRIEINDSGGVDDFPISNTLLILDKIHESNKAIRDLNKKVENILKFQKEFTENERKTYKTIKDSIDEIRKILNERENRYNIDSTCSFEKDQLSPNPIANETTSSSFHPPIKTTSSSNQLEITLDQPQRINRSSSHPFILSHQAKINPTQSQFSPATTSFLLPSPTNSEKELIKTTGHHFI